MHSAVHKDEQCSDIIRGHPVKGMSRSIWPQALSKVTARSKVMKGVCCTVDYSPPKHVPKVLRDKLYHLINCD